MKTKKRERTELTLLYRPGEPWDVRKDVSRIINQLLTEVYSDPNFPNHLIVLGYFCKKDIESVYVGTYREAVYKGLAVTHLDKWPFIPNGNT